MTKEWVKNATNNLFEKSFNKDNFAEARKEWLYQGLIDNEDCSSSCELCDHESIRYEYEIVNALTGQSMLVGSDCIKKFTDDFKIEFLDTKGIKVEEARLRNDKKGYFKQVLATALDEKLSDSSNKFLLSIAEKIKEDGKLTPNQLKHLKLFYASLNETGQLAFRKGVSVSLRRQREQEQYRELNSADKSFVCLFLTPTQKKKYIV